MNRRHFAHAVASLSLVRRLFTAAKGAGDEPELGSWAISAVWIQSDSHGVVLLTKNDTVEGRWRYETYAEWRKVTLLNAQFVADQPSVPMKDVAAVAAEQLQELHLNSSVFKARNSSDQSLVHVSTGEEAKQWKDR